MGNVFEIRFTHSGEVLANQLSEQKAVELLEVYKGFFGEGSVFIAYGESRKHTSWAQEYKNAYIDYFGELQEMGNLL